MTSAAQAKKEKLIAGLADVRRRILDAASSLSPSQQDEVFLGIWSVKDLLAHLAGWDFTNMAAAKEILAGKLPSFYAYHDRDWQTYNASLVAQYKREDFRELLALVRDSHRRLMDLLESIPASELDRDRGLRFKGYKVTIWRLLQVEKDDEEEHYTQMRQFASAAR